MTNEEAIERIKDIFGENPEPCILETFIDENDIDAVKLVIKALEGNTCDEREKGNCPFYTARGDV